MKWLTATKETQGQRENDFFWANEGEMLIPPVVVCDDAPDDVCGCRRSWAGLDSAKSTTTMLVAELGISRNDFLERLAEYDRKHWGGALRKSHYERHLKRLQPIIDRFNVGDILELREDFQVRRPANV